MAALVCSAVHFVPAGEVGAIVQAGGILSAQDLKLSGIVK
jgi:hypothetical protein